MTALLSVIVSLSASAAVIRVAPVNVPALRVPSAALAPAASRVSFSAASTIAPASPAARSAQEALAAAADASGWTRGEFASLAGGRIHYKSRPGDPRAPARVYVGGLALNESFETLFARGRAAGSEHFLWLRGHGPSAWTPTSDPYDADARDLARMIVLAGEKSGRVELVLHSYGTLVFQRMIQLGGADVSDALKLLRDSRVVMLNPTTHYGKSESVAGERYAQLARVVRALMQAIDAGDRHLERLDRMAAWNPALAAYAAGRRAQWNWQREALMSQAAGQAAAELRQHLSEPWAPELDGVRKELSARFEKDAKTAGWQEALLRRADQTSRLEFGARDVALLKALGIGIDLVHAHGDQLIPWVSARLLPELLGVHAPAELPRAGSTLTSADGQFRLIVAEGDHYLPLKRPQDVGRLLD